MVYLEWQAESPGQVEEAKTSSIGDTQEASSHLGEQVSMSYERLQAPWNAAPWVFAARNLLWAWLPLLASVFLAPPNSSHFTSPHSQDRSAAANVAVWTSLLFGNSEAQHWERESPLLCPPGPVGDHCGAEPSLAREHPVGGGGAIHSAGHPTQKLQVQF